MAVEIKLSDGTTLRTGTDEILDDLIRIFHERQQATFRSLQKRAKQVHVNPEQIVYIRTVR